MSKVIDLKEKKFGKLKVIEYYGSNKNGRALWVCQCECGNKKIISAHDLRQGKTKSCGCIHKKQLINRNTKHNLTDTPLYIKWKSIKNRCYNSKDLHYKYYGGRGIKMCFEWKNDFLNFYNWAIESGYNEHLEKYGPVNTTIDRIDVNGDYEPLNCRWATRAEQNRNVRTNRYITYNGETLCLKDMAKKYNINPRTLSRRIDNNLDIEKAITMPTKKERAYIQVD